MSFDASPRGWGWDPSQTAILVHAEIIQRSDSLAHPLSFDYGVSFANRDTLGFGLTLLGYRALSSSCDRRTKTKPLSRLRDPGEFNQERSLGWL